MTKETKRLLKLATHLERGELGQDKWNFAKLHNVGKCGTMGCAMGELPHVFPSKWKYFDDGDGMDKGAKCMAPVLRGGKNCTNADVIAFFGFNDYATLQHLFFPSRFMTVQDPAQYGGRVLGFRASRQQVAAQIRAFVAKCRS